MNSTKIKSIVLLVNDMPVGAAQSMSCSSNKMLVLDRIRFDTTKTSEAFSRGFVHRAAQKLPFQIVIEREDGSKSTITNVWLEDIPSTFHTEGWIICDDVKAEAEVIPEDLFS